VATAGKSTRDSSECPGLTTSAGPVYGAEGEKSTTGATSGTGGTEEVVLSFELWVLSCKERESRETHGWRKEPFSTLRSKESDSRIRHQQRNRSIVGQVVATSMRNHDHPKGGHHVDQCHHTWR
jgi:hypothetical protein